LFAVVFEKYPIISTIPHLDSVYAMFSLSGPSQYTVHWNMEELGGTTHADGQS